jgi:hypothetical protein
MGVGANFALIKRFLLFNKNVTNSRLPGLITTPKSTEEKKIIFAIFKKSIHLYAQNEK